MKILFLTLARIDIDSQRGIFTDLIHKFSNEGHEVYIITPLERRYEGKTSQSRYGNIVVLRIKTLNMQKTSIFEKGLSTLLLDKQFFFSIKKRFSDIKFDLVLYSTPPITFTRIVKYIKEQKGARSYLLLKDIFPQNAVDLGMIRRGGMIHRYFRKQEKALYFISDYIGCMSPENVNYIQNHNPQVPQDIIEVNPNSIKPDTKRLTIEQRSEIRKKYQIPVEAIVLIYGGNLGKPQGIQFLLKVLSSLQMYPKLFFVIAGSGTEYPVIKSWFQDRHPKNGLLLSKVPRLDYDLLLQSSDVGMIFLDHRFTIPNFPSRLLSYLEYSLPVICATDRSTDLGNIIEENQFGYWSESDDLETTMANIRRLEESQSLRRNMGKNGYDYLIANHTVSKSYETIIKHFYSDDSL